MKIYVAKLKHSALRPFLSYALEKKTRKNVVLEHHFGGFRM